MLSQAESVKWIKQDSDIEAILTESRLIRAHQPKFNFRLKDDKSPLYISITNDLYPRVLSLRKTDIGSTDNFKLLIGPFTSKFETQKVLKLARKAFPFCNAGPSQKKKAKACFWWHLGLCPGACKGLISQKEYAKNIKNLQLFLTGKKPQLIKMLERQMKKEAGKKNFEEAMKLKNSISAIRSITEASSIIDWRESDELQSFQTEESLEDLWKILSPYLRESDNTIPDKPFPRIEAYDVSNLSGKKATGSMIVFSRGKPDKQEYRKFRIRSLQEPNDPLMIREVLTRRLRHREWKLPDLILVDGGKGQVNAARQALAGHGLHHKIPVVGIAKRFENIIIFKKIYHLLKISKTNPALKLILHMRDEAHRFAKTYHKKLRRTSLTG